MNHPTRLFATALLVSAVAACSSSGNADKESVSDQAPGNSGTQNPGTSMAVPSQPSTPDTPVSPVAPVKPNTGEATQPGTPVFPVDGELPPPRIPDLDPLAKPIPGPSIEDPFGSRLEIDNEAAVQGGPPTTPKNLRIDLVSNDWAEFSWAPSNDDQQVVEYRIKRSDGHVYVVRGDQTDPRSGTQAEINKIWRTTSFIDCNYTRFADRLHDCNLYGPKPGDIFSYQVTAVDNQGQESGASNTITITYHKASGAAVPLYEDPYLDDAKFAQTHDLSNTAYFRNEMTLVFDEDFDGDSIDPAKWNTQMVWGANEINNGEQQYFVNTQDQPDFGYNPFKLANSTLRIEAIPTPGELKGKLPQACREPDPTGNERCLMLSGALSSHDKFRITYGYVESRMKTSDISGALSSFYLYHRYAGNGITTNAPEIDILEYLGENPYGDEDAFQTHHYTDVVTGDLRSAPTMLYKNPTGELFSDDWHTYGVLWEPQLIIWYIDGKEIKRITGPQVSRQGMNVVASLVTGSVWAPTPDVANGELPITLEIDYIRAWQRDVFRVGGLYPEL